MTVLYARELRDTAIKVNAANPGYTATDLNGHSGFRAAADAASASVHLATLSPDGPPAPSTATAGTPDGPLPW